MLCLRKYCDVIMTRCHGLLTRPRYNTHPHLPHHQAIGQLETGVRGLLILLLPPLLLLNYHHTTTTRLNYCHTGHTTRSSASSNKSTRGSFCCCQNTRGDPTAITGAAHWLRLARTSTSPNTIPLCFYTTILLYYHTTILS